MRKTQVNKVLAALLPLSVGSKVRIGRPADRKDGPAWVDEPSASEDGYGPMTERVVTIERIGRLTPNDTTDTDEPRNGEVWFEIEEDKWTYSSRWIVERIL